MVPLLLVSQDAYFDEYASALRSEGLACQVAATVDQVGRYLDSTASAAVGPQTGLAIVDGDLPEGVLVEVFRLLRATPNLPTLTLVSAEEDRRATMDVRSLALETFAMKPLGTSELVLRTKALMSRAHQDVPGESGDSQSLRSDGIHHGQIVAVFSPKGGVGKSTISVNLAVGLTQLFHTKTLLVDADLWFGDDGILLNMASPRSVLDIASQPDEEPSLAVLQQALVQHSSGLRLLLRPPGLSSAEKVQTESVVSAITSYKALFDYVIVDMHPALDELNLRILDVADRILLLTTPEVSPTHQTARFLELAQALSIEHKISLILNRSNSGIRLPVLEQQLHVPIVATVVSAGPVVVSAASHGVSLFEQDIDGSEKITGDLTRLVELVVGREAPVVPKAVAAQRDSVAGRR